MASWLCGVGSFPPRILAQPSPHLQQPSGAGRRGPSRADTGAFLLINPLWAAGRVAGGVGDVFPGWPSFPGHHLPDNENKCLLHNSGGHQVLPWLLVKQHLICRQWTACCPQTLHALSCLRVFAQSVFSTSPHP